MCSNGKIPQKIRMIAYFQMNEAPGITVQRIGIVHGHAPRMFAAGVQGKALAIPELNPRTDPFIRYSRQIIS